MSFREQGPRLGGEWQRALDVATAVAQEDDWRQALAEAVLGAAGGTFAVVAVCPPGRMLDAHPQAAPRSYQDLVEDIFGRFLPRIEEGADGPGELLRLRTKLYAPLDDAHNRELASRLRKEVLSPRGIKGLVNAMMVDEAARLTGWISIASGEDSASLLRRCGPLREVTAAASRTVSAALRLATGCGMRFPQDDPRVARLTGRERQLLKLLARGLTNVNIAQQLAISEETVRSHLRSMYTKLGVHSRAEAVGLLARS